MAKGNKETYRRLIRYIKPYKGRVALSLVASLGVAGIDAAYAGLVQPLVDRILVDRQLSWLPLVPFIIVALAAGKGFARYIQEYFIKTAGQLVVQDVRNNLYQHSVGLSMRFFAGHPSGTLMSKILNDVGIMQRSASTVLVDLLREGATVIGLTGIAFYRDWRLALVAFIILPLSAIPASIVGRKIKTYSRRGQSSLGNLTSVLQETFTGIKVIKAFGTEKEENERFRAENRTFYSFVRKQLKYDSASAPIIEILTSLGVAAVFWYGLHRVLSGAMSQGELLSFVAAMLMMYTPLKRLNKINNTVQQSMAAAERVFEVMDEIQEIRDLPTATPLPAVRGEVEFDRVSFAYDAEPVLKDFSLRIRRGEVIALVGASGAGKTTVAGLLNRFFDPTAGAIRIDGCDIRSVTLDSLKKNIALVDQETFLFNDSIRNNIRYGRKEASAAEVEEAARLAFADEFIRQMPDGYETRIGDRGVRLSGGQRQRLCIARAILRNAPILILDEATSALDTESEAMVQQALANLMRDRTTLVIAHRLSTVMHADRIVVLEGGEVREVGKHGELLKRDGLYRRLYDMQFRESA